MLMLKRSNFKVFTKLFTIAKYSHTICGDLRRSSLVHCNRFCAQDCASNWKNEAFKDHLNHSNTHSQRIDKMLITIDNNVKRRGRIEISEVENVFEFVSKFGIATLPQSLYLLRSCGFLLLEVPSHRVKCLNKVWKTLESIGTELNVKHYNALLKVYLDNNHVFSPAQVLVSMENQRIAPNLETYSYLMERYCEEGNINGANEILECIKEKRMTISEAIFNSLIKGHMKLNDTAGAKEIMEAMRNTDIIPSASTYTTLICGFIEQENIESAKEILLQAEREVSLQNHHYLQIIATAARFERDNFIDKILKKIENASDWKQDFINVAVNLTHMDMDKTAFKLILASTNSENHSSTNIFVKQLVKSNKPTEKIIQYCNEIYDRKLNDIIFLNSARISIDLKKFDLAFALLKEMQKKGIPVRLHYLTPIFMANKYSSEGMWKVLQNMYVLGLPIDFFSYVDYVLPAVSAIGSPEKLISELQKSGQSVSSFMDPLFHHYCFLGDLESALYLIEKYPIQINEFFKFDHLLSLYQEFKEKDTTFYKILKYVFENIGLSGQDIYAIRGEKLAILLVTNPSLFEEFHKSNIGQNCAYHSRCLEICKDIVRKKSPSLLNLFHKLESSKLQFKSNNYSKQARWIDEFSIHIKNKDVDKLSSLLLKFEKAGLVLPPGILSQLFSLHCELSDLDSAKNILKKLRETYPSFKTDSAKLFDYARNLLKFSKIEEAIDVIKNDCKEMNNFSGSDVLQKSMRRFLNNIVQTGDIELVKTIQNLLIPHAESLLFKEIILEPLLKIYLYRKDFDGSLNELNRCVLNYHYAPCLNLMLKKFILTEDQSKLQSLLDLASISEGQNKVLHQLAFACIELDRLDQAKTVMLNLQKNINSNSLEEYAKKLYLENKITALEGLLYVTAALTFRSKEKNFIFALKLHSKKNNPQKMNKILNLMDEANVDFSKESKELVNQLFLKNNLTMPFLSDINTTAETNSSEFLSSLCLKNEADSLKDLKKMTKGEIRSLSLKEISHLIDFLIEKKNLPVLSQNTYLLSYVIENANQVFKDLLEKYSQQGNVEALSTLASVFPDFSLKKCNYNTFLAKAYITSNRHEDLLLEFENRWDKKNKLFSVFGFQELLKIPHLKERTLQLAYKYLEANFDLPLAVTWAHNFINEDYEKANKISQKQLIPVDKIDSIVLRHVRQTENIIMGKKYAEFVSVINAKDRSKERAYGTLLDLLVSKQMYDQSVQLIMEAKSNYINLEKHYRATLITLENFLKKEKQFVPFKIGGEEQQR